VLDAAGRTGGVVGQVLYDGGVPAIKGPGLYGRPSGTY
jgi:hypothetical protein